MTITEACSFVEVSYGVGTPLKFQKETWGAMTVSIGKREFVIPRDEIKDLLKAINNVFD